MKTLAEIFEFDNSKFSTVTLAELDCSRSFDTSDNAKEWQIIRARSQSRDAPIYTEGLFKILRCQSTEPLTDSVQKLSKNEIIDRMPSRLADNNVIPSPSGEYVDVIEIYGSENENGTISLSTRSRSQYIPVELVIETVTYDEAILELID